MVELADQATATSPLSKPLPGSMLHSSPTTQLINCLEIISVKRHASLLQMRILCHDLPASL